MLTSIMITPLYGDINFINKCLLELNKTNNKIYNECDIRRLYGESITGIDVYFEGVDNNNNYIVCMQIKDEKTKPCISNINNFIICVEEIYKKNKSIKCYGIYVSRCEMPNPGKTRFREENYKNNNIHYLNIYNRYSEDNQQRLLQKIHVKLHSLGIFYYEYDGSVIMSSQ